MTKLFSIVMKSLISMEWNNSTTTELHQFRVSQNWFNDWSHQLKLICLSIESGTCDLILNSPLSYAPFRHHGQKSFRHRLRLHINYKFPYNGSGEENKHKYTTSDVTVILISTLNSNCNKSFNKGHLIQRQSRPSVIRSRTFGLSTS